MNNENANQVSDHDSPRHDSEDVNYAGFWIRVLASLIDSILVIAVIFPLLISIYGMDYFMLRNNDIGILGALIQYLAPAAAIIVFWIYKSATPGKMALGLKIVSLGANKDLSLGQSIGRYFGYYLSTIPLCVGFIWVAFDARKQGWHDKLAGTVVVHSEK